MTGLEGRIGAETFQCPTCRGLIAYEVATDSPARIVHADTRLTECGEAAS